MATPEKIDLISTASIPAMDAGESSTSNAAIHTVTADKLLPDIASGQLQRIQLITDAAIASLSLAELLPELLKRLRELLAGDMVLLLLLTTEGDKVRLHAIEDVWAGFQETDAGIEVPLGRGVAGRIAAQRQPIIVDNLHDVELVNPVLIEKQAHSLVGAPLLIEGRLTGVVHVSTTRPHSFSTEDAQLLQMAADRIALAVERARVYDAVHESEQRKSAMLEAALDCIVMMDHQGLITEFNPAAERTFGYGRDEVIGRPLAEVMVPPALREQHCRGLAHYLATGEGPVLDQRIEITGMRADGTEFPVELAIIATQLHGRPAFTGYLRDITERKNGEREREQLLTREQEARTQAEAANRAKDEFLAMLSHELRTPMTALLGWTYLLKTRDLEPELFQEAVESIDRNAKAQHRLIEDLLDISRIITGKLPLDLQPIDLVPVITAAVDTIRPAAAAKRLDLHLELRQDAGVVSGDAHRLQQVLWNLLSNAVKFTPKGGRIEVTLERVESYVEIRVADTGEGIDAGFLPHVFEPLRQADGSKTRLHGGLGLGLAIVRHLVELHGGIVRVASPGVGQGTTFRVRLPVRAVAATPSNDPTLNTTVLPS